jgi:protein-tyrosine-phosphatase
MGKELKRILFVCVENACRSQMAQGFAEVFGKQKWEVYSLSGRIAFLPDRADKKIVEEV